MELTQEVARGDSVVVISVDGSDKLGRKVQSSELSTVGSVGFIGSSVEVGSPEPL
jgi:hypothetical protein